MSDVANEVTVGHVGPMASEYVDKGIPFLRSLNIEPFNIKYDGVKFITPSFHKRLQKSSLRPGDVVIVRTGKPGTCAVIPDWLLEANCSDVVIVRCSERVRPRFLCYVVNSVAGHHISSHIVGAVQQHFNVGSARTLEFLLPSIEGQDAILAILGTLDDKIDLNRRMNETLEAMARALFRDWFVDFGPTRAKMAGQTPYLVTEIWELFPDRLDDEGKPEGWSFSSIYDVASVVYGAPFASSLFNTQCDGIPLVRIRDLPSEKPGVWTTENHPKGFKILPGMIVVGMDGEFRAHLWGGEEAWLNQRVCVFQPNEGISSVFLRETIIPQLKFIEDTEVATTVIHLGKGDIDGFTSLFPGKTLISAFNDGVEVFYKKIVQNKKEAQSLAQLRDLLLPKLMSGEIRVRDAEKMMANAL
ncbi:restriction endonuclease subunit S [Novacetimonas cocois]|uniref:Restriction endonuclease subunit S n=1 Tax=Novacetimonas cocois TaxID=1747507 RepID=A0A365Z189_9PROT|nr:restriction endonuclease subunit S [Novacetimonas cocois]